MVPETALFLDSKEESDIVNEELNANTCVAEKSDIIDDMVCDDLIPVSDVKSVASVPDESNLALYKCLSD